MSQTAILKAVRAKCLDCSNGSWMEVKLCPIKECKLYPYRFGKDPYSNRKGNPDALKKWHRMQNSNTQQGLKSQTPTA